MTGMIRARSYAQEVPVDPLEGTSSVAVRWLPRRRCLYAAVGTSLGESLPSAPCSQKTALASHMVRGALVVMRSGWMGSTQAC